LNLSKLKHYNRV